MKSAKLEWALEQLPAALRLLEDGVRAFPDFAKLWMMRGQILESLGRDAEAKEVYGQGVSWRRAHPSGPISNVTEIDF